MPLLPSLRSVAVATLLLSVSALARADIYGYIDARGDAHFAAEKLDDRYQLFMHSDRAIDSFKVAPLTAGEKETPLFRYLSKHPNLKKFEKILLQAADDYELDPALLKAVMAAESGFNPTAVSPKGAVGLMQVMPATAERFGVQSDKRKTVAQKLTDPKTNIRLGARYLRFLRDMFPDAPHLVIASYNAGEGAVQKYNNAVPPYPETRNYVKVVSQFYHLYQPAVQNTQSAIFSSNVKGDKRLHMTIPGRRNLPIAPEYKVNNDPVTLDKGASTTSTQPTIPSSETTPPQ